MLRVRPAHVAIIMDGNGRWAAKRGLPRLAGHSAGAKAVRETIASAIELGVSYLTIYSFSSENWNRPADEVSGLMSLFVEVLERELANLAAHERTGAVIGAMEALPDTDECRVRSRGREDRRQQRADARGGAQLRCARRDHPGRAFDRAGRRGR